MRPSACRPQLEQSWRGLAVRSRGSAGGRRWVGVMMAALLGVASMACIAVPTIVLVSPAGSASPTGQRTNILNSVSCETATSCFVVGATSIGPNAPVANPAITFAGRWNGKTFSALPIPNAPGATSSLLNGVSCTSVKNCFAVGDSVDSNRHQAALVEQWNGKAWSIVASPKLTYTAMNAVSCTSATFCFAVGQGSTGAETLVERWNGQKWSLVTSPKPGGSPAELEAVSCVSTKNCSAVGDYSSSVAGEALPLFEHWNGKTWSMVAGTRPSAPNPRLTGVACPFGTTCLALGSGDTGLLNSSAPWTARGNGTTWTVVAPARLTARSAALPTVACASSTDCFAVGSLDNATNGEPQPHPLVERWNGKAWVIIAAARTATGIGGWFNSVSCQTATTCLAVGASVTLINTGGYYRQKTLIERWNGKAWSIVASS